MKKFGKSIEQYIFKPLSRIDTDDHVQTTSCADSARSDVMSAKRIRLVCQPTVGECAVFTIESEECGCETIYTSTVREFLFDEDTGIITIKTQNSIYLFNINTDT